MFKNSYYFFTATSLLRFQNTLIINQNGIIPAILLQNYLTTPGGVVATARGTPLTRRLIQLMYSFNITLYSKYRIRLKLVGNGYYLQLPKSTTLTLFTGNSHLNTVQIPSDLSVTISGRKKRILILSSTSRSVVQNFATFLINLAYPDVYRLKGLRYLKQTLSRKEGKKKFV